MKTKVLVCGGRDYDNQENVSYSLTLFHTGTRTIDMIIEGGAKGADRCGREWAKLFGIHFATVPALWDYYQKRSGHLRNEAMLWLLPDYCVAFPGESGTRSMIDLCKAAGIPVWEPYS